MARIRQAQIQRDDEVSLGEPRRRTVRKREGDDHPLGLAGSRHRAKVNFDDDAPTPNEPAQRASALPVTKSSSREDAPAPSARTPVTTTAKPSPARPPEPAKPAATPARATTAKAELPQVLTWEGVRSGKLPEGSGMPSSLEQDVPPQFRFWKAESPADALLVREALVESGLFTSETVRLVNGDLRRVHLEQVVKMFLAPAYDDAAPVVVPPVRRAVEKAAMLLVDSEKPVAMFDEDVSAALGLDTILEKVGKLKTDWLIAARDSAEVRKSLVPGFRLKNRTDLIFATSADLSDPDAVEWVTEDRATALVKFASHRDVRIVKAKAEAEERVVIGVVLEPDEVDAQGDTISKEEIKNAAYRFMEEFAVSGIQHKEFAGGRLKILESWIAPQDITIGDQVVKEGTWMMTKRVVDDDLWAAAKAGKFTGFSIGGSAIRKPVQ